ncbi:hypothetical protein [Paracerasibacillus soli]|uniref:Uncharacterized protein n=1 Tax=Paracerasibacillus soli TaxID=480284 RepID=A0ABU5CTE6_9BACI|nr:hypothetical protein [Virgibacillus soli]MDY0409653.1 hypothetical protein [Virgibacillus soli]
MEDSFQKEVVSSEQKIASNWPLLAVLATVIVIGGAVFVVYR